MRILFTGSNGFLASFLINKFKNKNEIIKCDLPALNINKFSKLFHYLKKKSLT